MRNQRLITAALLLLAVGCASAAAVAGSQKVLVLLESLDLKLSHSDFFGGLAARGYELDFRKISDKKLQLKEWDNWVYDKLIIFGREGGEWRGPTTKLRGARGKLLLVGTVRIRHRAWPCPPVSHLWIPPPQQSSAARWTWR